MKKGTCKRCKEKNQELISELKVMYEEIRLIDCCKSCSLVDDI